MQDIQTRTSHCIITVVNHFRWPLPTKEKEWQVMAKIQQDKALPIQHNIRRKSQPKENMKRSTGMAGLFQGKPQSMTPHVFHTSTSVSSLHSGICSIPIPSSQPTNTVQHDRLALGSTCLSINPSITQRELTQPPLVLSHGAGGKE